MENGIDTERYEEAVLIVRGAQQCSVSLIQRRLRIGYTAATKIVDELEQRGVVGPYEGYKPRTVLAEPLQAADKPANGQEQPATPPKDKPVTKDTDKPKRSHKSKAEGKARGNKRSVGRPALWDELDMPSKLDAIRGWSMQGAGMEDLAAMLGVSKTTLYEWQRDFPQFADAVKAGRHISNGELLNAAFKQAVGYTYTEKVAVKYKTIKQIKDRHGNVMRVEPIEGVRVVDVEKFMPGNAVMNQFMLKNRMPDQYKDKQHIEHGGLGGNSDFSYMSDDELDAEIARMEALERGEATE